jgi:hypothetical protein
MSPPLANEAELYFDQGGPGQRFTQRLGARLGLGHSILIRVLFYLALTWFPLLLFSIVEGRALGPSPQESLLLDFGTFARFFLGIPLLLIAELIVGPRLRAAGLQFVERGFVRPEDYPAFDRAIARAAKWRESAWAELIILGIALVGAWSFTAETIYGEGIASWRSTTRPTSAGEAVSLTGMWYRFVALPILQFIWYRWLWRLFTWMSLLWSASRLNLDLVALHADQAGGLAFLGTAHSSLGIFAFALSCVLSAETAFLVIFQKVDIATFQFPYFAILVIVEVIVFGPLLMFSPILIRSRLTWLHHYSLLVARYNRAFHEKWILGKPSGDEPLLGSADIQSLADLGSSFEYARGMSVVPFSRHVVIYLAIVTSLPYVPLLLLVMPIDKILNLLTKAVF